MSSSKPQKLPRIRKLGLMEKFHVARCVLGLDPSVVGSARYTAEDGTKLTPRTLYPALRALIERNTPLGIRLEGDEPKAKVHWVRLPRVDLSRIVEFSSDPKAPDLERVLGAQLARGFATQTDLPLWRIQVFADNTVVFAFHHAIADGMSAMAFHVQLLRALQQGHAEDDAAVVEVPQTLAMIPCVDDTMNIRPTMSLFLHELRNLVVPPSSKHWTGNPVLKVPDATTRVRITSLSSENTHKLLAACRAHQATLTGTLHGLLGCVVSQLLAQTQAQPQPKFKIIPTVLAVSMRPNANIPIPDDELCDYPSIFHSSVPVRADFAWDEAARTTQLLKQQKVKSKDLIGMLGLLFGQYKMFFEDKYGKKREAGILLSNLGRWTAPKAVEGKWRLDKMVFAQCDVVVGAPFSCNVVGEPNGAVNLAFAWGNGIEDEFMEKLVPLFEAEVAKLIQS
ncbi:hypothetical protein MKEN_01045800 [Mycena kentingensis (nom. inval.)]|nr:hypothetical protein MKEN_01045800 [Mycena kentingensis (nom. inval.)]